MLILTCCKLDCTIVSLLLETWVWVKSTPNLKHMTQPNQNLQLDAGSALSNGVGSLGLGCWERAARNSWR